jgi:hypothetical protein
MIVGRRVLQTSTTADQADAFWEKARSWLQPAIDAGIFYKNESRRILALAEGMDVRWSNVPKHLRQAAEREADLTEEKGERSKVYRAYTAHGRIKVKTAWDADSLRGDYADDLVFDECAYLHPDAWKKVGAPMLLDNDGNAYFISTPDRRNWFFELYNRGVSEHDLVKRGEMKPEDQRWMSWQFTSYDNPHLSPKALAELMRDMTEEDIKQEILAQFLENDGAVFRNVETCMTAPLKSDPADHVGHLIVGGVDWGKQKDYTVISMGCVTCGIEVDLDRFRQIGWSIQRDRVITKAKMWRPSVFLIEHNSIGGPNFEQLVEDYPQGNFMAFEMTPASKPQVIRALGLGLERTVFRFIPNAIATGELLAYESKTSRITGHTTYSAPEGGHDDTVVARMLMYRAGYGPQIMFSVADASEIIPATPAGVDAVLQELLSNPATRETALQLIRLQQETEGATT